MSDINETTTSTSMSPILAVLIALVGGALLLATAGFVSRVVVGTFMFGWHGASRLLF